MAMSSVTASVDTLIDAASAAIEAGTYDVASQKLLAAQVLLAKIPRTRGADGAEVDYKLQAITDMLAMIDKKAAGGALQIGVRKVTLKQGGTTCSG